MKLAISTAVITHDEGVTQFVAVEHGDLIARIGDWCREHWSSVSADPPPADVRDLIDAYFYDNAEDSLEVSEDSLELPEPYASTPELLSLLQDVAETPKHGEPEPCDLEFDQDWEAEMGRYAIGRLHELIDCARAVIAKTGGTVPRSTSLRNSSPQPPPNTNKPTTPQTNIMKTTIKDNVLHIEIPLHEPRPSSSGKTLTVASSNGNQPTEAKINGQPVIVGINAYIRPER